MEGKPVYFDGSFVNKEWIKNKSSSRKAPYHLTDEMRKHIGVNPHGLKHRT